MIRTTILVLLLSTCPAWAVKPTAVLCNGAGQYQPAILTPLAELGGRLEQQGFRVIINTHLNCANDEEPVLVVGHSAGGAAALAFAKKQFEEAKFQPTLILLDAAPAWTGVWKSYGRNCYAIRTPFYPHVNGCRDIKAPSLLFAHVTIAFSDKVQRTVLKYSAGLVGPK